MARHLCKKRVINANAAMHYRAAIQNTSESGRQLILASLGVRLGFRQLAFSGDAFVRFIDALDSVFILAGTLRQRLSDYINAAWGTADDRRHKLYKFAGMKFVVRHGVSTSRKGVSITLPAAAYQAITAMGEEWKSALRLEAERRKKRSVSVHSSQPPRADGRKRRAKLPPICVIARLVR